jgi:hypothetical protein
MRLIFRSVEAKYRLMLKAILGTLRFFILILAGHQDIALENATLRQQLTILKRQQPRPKLRRRDRLFWIALMKIWKQWKTVARRRTTRYFCELAAAAIQAVLEEAVPEEGTRASEGLCRGSEAGSNDGRS